jgi:hypothetical protein
MEKICLIQITEIHLKIPGLEENMIKSLVSIIAIMILMVGSVSALDGSGINAMPVEGSVSQYSQYYTMPSGTVAGTHIVAPQQYPISGNAPATVYYQQKAIPYDQFFSSAAYMEGNFLWIAGSMSWTQYVVVPQGAYLSLIAATATGGNGYLNEIYPDGRLLRNNYYYFPGYNKIGFYADTIGQHILLFAIDDQVSNVIVVNVVGYQPPVYQQPLYQLPVAYAPLTYPFYYLPYPPKKIPRKNVTPHHWPH